MAGVLLVKLLQPSLSAGELDPGLHGRVDIQRYAIGLKTCRNVITLATGGGRKRPGTFYRGTVKTSANKTRILPFIYSTEVRYLIEAGNLYFRFWYVDANSALVRLESPPGTPVEIVTPYTTADLEGIRYTQSADVLYLTHPSYAPRELRRLTSSSFELRNFDFRLGPFRSLNIDEAAVMAVSAAEGNVTVTTNVDTFTADMVGSLVYVEEKELRTIKPWEPLDRSVTIGMQKRSDGKVYKATAIATPGAGGTPYTITGNTKPIHDTGRAWDGPGDQRNDGVNAYAVGVEWEYLHSGYGIVKITGFTDARTVTGTVISRIPDAIVGTAPSPAHSWTFSGNGSTKQFSITGAGSASKADYTVTINGVPVQSDPGYTGGGSGGGGSGGNLPDKPRDSRVRVN